MLLLIVSSHNFKPVITGFKWLISPFGALFKAKVVSLRSSNNDALLVIGTSILIVVESLSSLKETNRVMPEPESNPWLVFEIGNSARRSKVMKNTAGRMGVNTRSRSIGLC